MDYQRHYDLLCERAKGRKLSGYREQHHIIPRCLGGTDDSSNIVELTAEEHYVAHQLLVKIYPDNSGLVFAAIRMTGHSYGDYRSNNKIYGWLRRKNAIAARKNGKQRTGRKNGSYGTRWIYNMASRQNKKISSTLPIPDEWYEGRVMNFDKREEKLNEKEEKLRKIYLKTIKEIEPLYQRYKDGESLTSVAKDYRYSFQSLHLKFQKYFPRVIRHTGRSNTLKAPDD